MNRALPVVAFAFAFVAGAALAQVRLADTSKYTYDLENCDGGVTANIPDGTYIVTIKDETVWECTYDAGCAAGGQFFKDGLTMRQDFKGPGGVTPVSCRSAASTGDVCFTLLPPGVP
jgi:hypothetical protein